MEEKLELFAKGCLGGCWDGKYHYLEPWAGCGHDCPYCYARLRSPVTEKLAELGASFDKPLPLYPQAQLLEKISGTANSGEIATLKLCRYTDIFSPEFVKSGLALKVLERLVSSKIKRIIITTKGLPDKKIIALLASAPDKFSYNAAARPLSEVFFENKLAPLAKRLSAATEISRAGVLTTVHLDPFVAGFDDEDRALSKFLGDLKELGLNRVMFSYLLLSRDMLSGLAGALKPELLEAITALYDMEAGSQYLPGSEESGYWSLKPEVKRASVEKTALLLEEMGFEFVLCSLKNTPGLDISKFKKTILCDGKFYA